VDWELSGNAAIARGHVATVLIATSLVSGAQTTLARAVQPAPGLPSGKCALQLYAERIIRVQKLAARSAFGGNAPVTRPVQFYVMTSPNTHEQVGGRFAWGAAL